jgi:hypothetical protein
MSELLKIPSVESLDLKVPADIAEDLISRAIYDGVMQGKNRIEIPYRYSSIDREVLNKLEAKGYHANNIGGTYIEIYW